MEMINKENNKITFHVKLPDDKLIRNKYPKYYTIDFITEKGKTYTIVPL
jgi:hypothetical protein